MYVTKLFLILLFYWYEKDNLKDLLGCKYLGQFFRKNSGSQEDNQASIFSCPHSMFGRLGHLNFAVMIMIHIPRKTYRVDNPRNKLIISDRDMCTKTLLEAVR